MKRTAQDVAALKANALEAAVMVPALAAALVAAIVTARMTAGADPATHFAWIAGVTAAAHYSVRGLLRLIVRDAQKRLHVVAGCVDCTDHG